MADPVLEIDLMGCCLIAAWASSIYRVEVALPGAWLSSRSTSVAA
jgi:hypothetical protein